MGREFNMVKAPLVVLNCWRVEDIRFAFDSSFVTHSPEPSSDLTSDPAAKPFSDIRTELKVLAGLVRDNPGCPLAVFGRSDPVGPRVDPGDDNKALSGRRATAAYALLFANQELSKAVSLRLPENTSMSNLISSYPQKLYPQERALGSGSFHTALTVCGSALGNIIRGR